MKGPQYILEAAPKILAIYPDANFVFVGGDQDGYAHALKEMSKTLGLSDHAIFTGPIYDFNEKMAAYASSDVFVLPSGYEGTSQALFEAMSQARPIVATNRGGIPFQVEDRREGLLVEYGDPESLSKAILQLLNDRSLAKTLGKNARERVTKYTYPLLAKDLESIFLDLLNEKSFR